IALLELPLPQQCVDGPKRAGFACDEQDSARIAVQPMHQLEGFIGPQCAQRLDDPEADAASAMDGDTCRLIQYQQPFVLPHDCAADSLDQLRRRLSDLRRGPNPHGRYPDLVVSLQAGVGAGPVTVDADLTLADDPVNTAPRQVPEQPVNEVIQP